MFESRDLKSFIILEKMCKKDNQLSLDSDENNIRVNNTSYLQMSNISEHEVLKEFEREIPTEILGEDGEIIYEYQTITRVARIVIWDYKDLPYMIAFIRGVGSLGIPQLVEEVLDYKVRRVNFDKEFFNHIIDFNRLTVIQTTFKSRNTEQEFSMKGLIKDESSNLDNGYITELEIEMNYINIRARLSKIGRAALFGAPNINSIKDFTDMLTSNLRELRNRNEE